MELSLHQKMLAEYELTSKQMAETLGISTNALKCRLKRGNRDELEFRIVDGKKLFKRPRGNQGDKTPSIRPPGRWNETNKKKKKDWSEVRRGTTHIGEAKYPNEAFRKHNELKILNRINKEVPQHVLNKINPRLLALAQEEANTDLEKAQGKFTEPKYYGGMNQRNNRRYTHSYLTEDQQRVDTSFKPNKNYNYYEVNSSEDRRDTRPTEYTWSEPKVREPGADYKPGKFKHLDDAIRKAKK